MLMHVNAKKMATAGLLVAFTVIMLVLSSVVESSSLFFIAAASFCVGISIRERGLRLGFAFLIASVLINFLVSPNKLYCVTFAAMETYLFLAEWLWERIAAAKEMSRRMVKLWCGKYLVFNLMYIPVILCFPSLIFTKEVTWQVAIILFLAGQIALWIYDLAYRYFQGHIWGRLRVRLLER